MTTPANGAARIVPITLDLAAGYREALGIVARERLYLRLTDAPSRESSLAFVSANIAKGNPHLVALAEGNVVGWCDISRDDVPAESHVGGLGMGVVPTFRGQGIGRRLITAALAAADAADFHRVELRVYSRNVTAIALYDSVGFVHEGRLRDAIRRDNGYDDILIMGRLRPQR